MGSGGRAMMPGAFYRHVPLRKHTITISANTAWFLYNFRAGLIRSLVLSGYRVVVLAPPDGYFESLRSLDCEVVGLPMDNKGTNPVRDAALFLRFRKHYRRYKPSVVLHFTIKPVIYGSLAARTLGIPYLNTIPGLGTPFILENWVTRAVELLYRASQQRAERLFFLNEDDHQVFVRRRLAPPERMEVLGGEGVDLQHFPMTDLPGGTEFRFLFIGRMLRDKGVMEFAEAARRVRTLSGHARFQLLGPCAVENRTAIQRETIDGWVREGIIEYLGETADVRPHIARAHCIVLPSYREGSPRTLLEGAAMGRPLIATDTPGCRDIVEDCVNGLLCRARDATDLANTMQRLLSMPSELRRTMGEAGRAKVARSFSEEGLIDRYRNIIDRTELGGAQTSHRKNRSGG
jgi:glycosyltransferase involved in cell wall biosynthesis